MKSWLEKQLRLQVKMEYLISMDKVNMSIVTTSAEDLIKMWGSYLVTLDQREQLIKIIDQVVEGLFDSNKSIAFDIFPPQFRLGLPEVEFPLKEYSSADVLGKYFNEVKDILLELPFVELILSFYPSTNFLAIVLDQVRIARQDLCLIKYQYDPYILGGAVIKTDGIIADYSLRKLIDIF